jgi:DNA-directed RNA polymerase specialized sigma24 family protein
MDFKILLETITPALKYIARKNLLYGFYDEKDLFQEMSLYLWEHYKYGLPIGINKAYVIKACEFHLKNFLRKGGKKPSILSLDAPIGLEGQTLGDVTEDKNALYGLSLENKLTIDEIQNIGLTSNEKSVLTRLLEGLTIREVAKDLEISHVMVLKYKKNIIKKLHKKGYQT